MPGKHYTDEEFKDVIRLHGVEGKSFEEIIPILKEKYGQDRTVRALQVIYSDRKDKYPDIVVPAKVKKQKGKAVETASTVSTEEPA